MVNKQVFIYQSVDEMYGLKIDQETVNKILEYCKKANTHETGGILIGYYTIDLKWAIITDITGAPKDSIHNRCLFYRGIKGLQKILDIKWERERNHYLGEWHYHPYSQAISSQIDDMQMIRFANDRKLNCPEPLLLIIGGDPRRKWEIRTHVFVGRKKKDLILC